MVTDSKTSGNTPTCFGDVAATLMAHGYLVIPIRPGEKRPAMGDWPNARLTATDVPRFARCGAGVLCGTGKDMPIGVDLDIRHVELARRTRKNFLDLTGCVPPERIGEAPKMLFPCRIEGPLPKETASRVFVDTDGKTKSQIELLGNKKQFVVAGIHPDTQKPYKWINAEGKGPLYEHISTLPVVTLEQLQELIRRFEKDALELGLTPMDGRKKTTVAHAVTSIDADDPFANHTPRSDMTMDEARELLQYFDSDAPYTKVWIRVGMALHHQFQGGEEALDLWDEWSRTSTDKYENRADLESHWKSFRLDGEGLVSTYSLVKDARENTDSEVLRDLALRIKRSILEHAEGIIAKCRDLVDLTEVAAPRLGKMTAGHRDLAQACESMLSVKSKEFNGAKLRIDVIREAMKKGMPVAPKAERRADTDLGNMHRVMDVFGGDLMYVFGREDPWHFWNGVYWEPLPKEILGEKIQHVIEKMPPKEVELIRNEEELIQFEEHCTRSQQGRSLEVLQRVLQNNNNRLKKCQPEDLNARLNLLGVGNGVVDLDTSELLPAGREYLITSTTHINYDPKAKCPKFIKALRDVFKDPQTGKYDWAMVWYFQRLIGLSLLGTPEIEPTFAILYGTGANGKSTILRIIKHVLGDYAIKARGDFFSRKRDANGEGATSGLMRTMGKRLLYLGETNSVSKLDSALIKDLTGGEEIAGRAMYKGETEFKPTAVPFMATNHRPELDEVDPGIRRRIAMVPFERNFLEEGIDNPHLYDELLAEVQGIFTWCVRGALKYRKRGRLHPPERALLAKQEYIDSNDKLHGWREKYCELGEGFSEKLDTLYDSYYTWTIEERIKFLLSKGVFDKKLVDQGFKSHLKRIDGKPTKVRKGIRLQEGTTTTGDFE